MRKLCILLTVLLLCFLIVACGNQKNADESNEHSNVLNGSSGDVIPADSNNDGNTEQSFSSSLNNEMENVTDSSYDDNNDNGIVEPVVLNFNEINEYKTFLQTYELPHNFVKYEDVSMFGEFASLIFISDAYNGDYSQYSYVFHRNDGGFLSLNIELSGEPDKGLRQLTPEDVEDAGPDMRLLKVPFNGLYEHGKVKYYYYNRKLQSVRWTVSGVYYILDSMDFDEFSIDSKDDALVLQLINKETASDTLKELFGEEFGK